MSENRRRGRGVASAAALAAGLALVAGCGGAAQAPRATGPAATSPAPPGGATPGGATPAADAASGPARVATVRGAGVGVYARPGAARPRTRLASPNAYGVPRVLLVTTAAHGWLRVLLPTRPNGSTGWVRTSGVTLSTITRRVVVRLRALRFAVYDGARVVRGGRIAVGTRDTPTPPGRYYVTEVLRAPDPTGDYGPYAFGLSGHSPRLRTFAGGPGQLALHGTDRPELIGHRVSHGCIRLPNADITWMARTLAPGTPVTVRP